MDDVAASDHLSAGQFGTHMVDTAHLAKHYADESYVKGPDAHLHEGDIAKLSASMSEHGYRPEMAEDPIVVRGNNMVAGSHRVWGALDAGISKLPVEFNPPRYHEEHEGPL